MRARLFVMRGVWICLAGLAAACDSSSKKIIELGSIPDTCETAFLLDQDGIVVSSTCNAQSERDLSCSTPGKPEVFFQFLLKSDASTCTIGCLSAGIVLSFGPFDADPCSAPDTMCAGAQLSECSGNIVFGPGPAGRRYLLAVEVEPAGGGSCGDYSFDISCQ